MAVYVTKEMLSKFSKIEYSYKPIKDDPSTSNEGSHWQRVTMESNANGTLSKGYICRVCARAGNNLLSEMMTNSYDIMTAICRITNVVINPDDSLPKYICNDCLEALRIAINFKSTCESSDRKFRRILNPMGDPSFHSYPYSRSDFQMILHQMKAKQLKIEQEKEQLRQKKYEMEQKKAPKVKEFKCSPCDMNFPNKEKLAAHRRERQCMRRACDVCGQLVLSIGQHMRHIHKQSAPHKCPTCGKEFPIVARLKNHMLVHTNTFNFFCDLCPYKCKHKYYLVMHMRTHTGEKPYKCAQCPATFVNPSNLNKHKLKHQEKQFKCGLCEKAFRTSPALREHHDAIHMNIKHACNYCGRFFCYKSDLRKHEIRNHNRVKRSYVGGEPTYKQVERLEKMQEISVPGDKWRADDIVMQQQTQVLQTAYVDPTKDYANANHHLYFSDVSAIIHQPQIVQQQTVQLTLPDLEMKKDDSKIYETQHNIGYY